MTTGMSAPPIGTINKNPRASETNKVSQNATGVSVATNSTISSSSNTPSPALSRCWPVKTSGRPVIKPCYFPKATTDPVNVIAPIAMPIDISTRLLRWIEPRTPIP